MIDVIMDTTDSDRLHAASCLLLHDQRMAWPCQALQAAGVPGVQGGSMFVIVLALLVVLSLHALITGRTLSPSVQALGPRTVRVLGGVGLALALFSYLIDRTHNRVIATIALGGDPRVRRAPSRDGPGTRRLGSRAESRVRACLGPGRYRDGPALRRQAVGVFPVDLRILRVPGRHALLPAPAVARGA